MCNDFKITEDLSGCGKPVKDFGTMEFYTGFMVFRGETFWAADYFIEKTKSEIIFHSKSDGRKITISSPKKLKPLYDFLIANGWEKGISGISND